MLLFFVLHVLAVLVAAFEVPLSDTDGERQVCSGMWGGPKAHINVSFEVGSEGQVAIVIYEWKDASYLGKETSKSDDTLPRTYICTTSALEQGLCEESSLGHFIFDLPPDKSLNDASFFETRLGLKEITSESSSATSSSIEPHQTSETPKAEAGFWDNPAGNPTPTPGTYDSPWRRATASPISTRQNTTEGNDSVSIEWYKEPLTYKVDKTGYYCVAIVPITVDGLLGRQEGQSPHYQSIILFRNTFDGKLPATDYPKVNFYFAMFLVYSALGGVWAFLCFKHRDELLPIQFHISGIVGFLVIENIASWIYYRYLNAHGATGTATVFLFVVAILDAGRNALSLFLLLIVSLGLSVVRESLGRTMLKCRVLAAAHFVFGVLYAIGIVKLQLESTSALILLFFVIPLAITLSGFMLWFMYALNGTINELRQRKQHYKLSMFRRLYFILLGTIFSIVGFFILSSLQFSDRFAEDYAARTWATRWWYLDGFLALLYLVVFWSIAYLWRPTEHNRR
ncbi:hypothetical protein M422DRAFT_62056 [Sphaerobolus stellatus SS14]|uniref:Unplaced genomic scaffold SPHSTscaffold_269, whole genome shotgun sequence n=1 Tax=Sphaerobolus stellatus (strain SS14) TaxID=990650 RepID=A0A0C9TD79_SPHS4|nr:hypothetical protein M422DRAFT_62056 [Sphaerobolus stellatus SS14]